jgi:tetratricopeptide (TPR) repeat protein
MAWALLALAWTALLSSDSTDLDLEWAVAHTREAGDAWALGPALWYLWWRNGPPDLAGAEAMLAEGLALSRRASDDWIAIWWARVEGAIARVRADYPRARATAEELGRIARMLGDRSSQGNALLDRGLVALAVGDAAIALPSFRDARAIYRDVADRAGVAMADLGLSETNLLEGNVDAARDPAAEALNLARELRDPSITGWALRVNAEVGLANGEPVMARAQLAEAISLYRDRFSDALPPLLETPLPLLLETVARVAAAEGEPARALRVAAAASVERVKRGLKPRPIDEARLAPALRQAEQMLTDAECFVARTDGQAMTPEQVIAEALTAKTE